MRAWRVAGLAAALACAAAPGCGAALADGAAAGPALAAGPARAGPAPAAGPAARRAPPAGEGEAGCRAGQPFTDTVAALESGGEIRLSSGRRVLPVDLRLPEQPSGAEGRPDPAGWLATLPGSAVQVRPVGPPDRWERIPAQVALGPVDLGEILVAEGLALVDAGERDALCRPALLGLEAAARRDGLGLWRRASPLDAHDPDALLAAAERFVLAEGRIASVGVRSARTYLNFGRDFGRDFAVVLPRRSWAALERRGWSAGTLRGRRVRVRGTVELRRGPVMEIAVPDMIEVLDERPGGR